MTDTFSTQNGKDLLAKAIELWKTLEHWNNVDDKIYEHIEKDPIANLLTTALAHQTNLINEQINSFQTKLLSDFIKKIAPYNLTKAIPAVTLIHTALAPCNDSYYWVNENTPFILEKRMNLKNKTKIKEIEKFTFLPLIKAKIINANISQINKIDKNKFLFTLKSNTPFDNISGLTLYFTNPKIKDIKISCNNINIPVFSSHDLDNLPLCPIFNINHFLFNQSLIYGSTENWLDLFSNEQLNFFYINYPEKLISFNNETEITLQLEIINYDDININQKEILINCFPIVNVEKNTTSLSVDEPIKKITSDKQLENHNSNDIDEIFEIEKQKNFLNILAPEDNSFDNDSFIIRRFGTERFNKNELIMQVNSLVNKFSSDFYAFQDIPDLEIDNKMHNLQLLIKDIADILQNHKSIPYGVYLILKKNLHNLNDSNSRLKISYLLTDGARANNIPKDSSVTTPVVFDKRKCSIIFETIGGKNEIVDDENIKNISQYYFLTKDKIVTKSDIKSFCFMELQRSFQINKNLIDNINISNEIIENERQIIVHISLKKSPLFENNIFLQQIATTLQTKICIRSTNVYPINININPL